MSRVRKRDVEVMFSEVETVAGGGWFVAEDYWPYKGEIKPRGGFARWTPDVLSDTDAFLTFARLSAHGEPSRDTILKWVRARGLLRRAKPENRLPHLEDGTVNQKPESVDDFRAHSANAYRLLRLFELWRARDVGAPRERMTLARLHPPGEPDTAKFAEVRLDGRPTPYVVSVVDRDGNPISDADALTDEIVLDACKTAVQADVEPNITAVRPVFAADGSLALRCPDLLTGMYWQLACLVSGKRESAICEGCGGVFEKRRRNHYACDSTCRSTKSRNKKF